MTDAERLLWYRLRGKRFFGQKFRRQEAIGKYVVDFVHYGTRLIIEADGGQHAESADDQVRDAWLRGRGYTVLRFWNNEIFSNTDGVLEKILETLNSLPPLPQPLPREGGGELTAQAINSLGHRPIRSFVLRQGRMTDAQRDALRDVLPRFALALGESTLDLQHVYGRRAPVILEIGFGNGDALAVYAQAHPEYDFLGVEVHRPGVGSLLQKLEGAAVTNVRVAATDVMDVLAHLPPQSLHGVHLFFPDPWPKKRHHKRRLLQSVFAARIAEVLAPGGYLHCATDWYDYAEQMLAVLSATPGLVNTSPNGMYVDRPVSRPVTRFERRGEREGRPPRDLVFRKV